MRVDNVTIDKAAQGLYSQMIATLGLQGARKCQLQIGRLLKQERIRRDKLDGGKKRA